MVLHSCCRCLVTESCLTLCNLMDCSTPGSSILHISQSLLRLMSIDLVMLSNHFILCCPLLLLPSIFPSIRVFSNKLALCIRQPEYWRVLKLQHLVLPMNIQDWFPSGWTGLISLQSKGLSKSLLQHHNSKASVLQCSTFFMVQLSHLSMTTGKNHSFD